MKKVIILLAAWASLASAQETLVEESVDEAGPRPRYTVEVIIFAYTEDASVGSEIFVPDPPPPEAAVLLDEDGNPILIDQQGNVFVPGEEISEFGDTVSDETQGDAELDEDAQPTWIAVPPTDDLLTGDDEPAARMQAMTNLDPDLDAENPFQLILLQEDEMQLGNVINRFELLDAYETLMHFGWTQPTFPEEETPPIDLQLFGEPPAGLAGTVTLYLSRYLHFVVDLALDAPTNLEEEVIEDDTVPSFGDDRPSYSDIYQEYVGPVRFRIQEDRILKNGELRYFDHPKFGVLAKVTRVEEPEDDSDGVSSEEGPDPVDSSVQ